MKLKRIFSLFLCFTICLLICGCKNSKNGNNLANQAQNAQANNNQISLLYCANDTYDPYKLISKSNFVLCQLLYDPLYKTDNNFEPIAVLAQNAVQEGTKWTISLKQANFTDSTPLTAQDVIFSFELAKNCPIYSSGLSYVESVTASNNDVIFELSINDPYFKNVLNFPIIKTGSNAIYNEDNVLAAPIGTGRYILNQEKNGLNINENYFGEKGSIGYIKLIDAPDSESISHYVEVGATDIYYADTSEGSIIRMSGKKEIINRNVLVYIGINDNNWLFKDINIRYAVSSALDREKIVTSAFFGNAIAATGPFHPAFKAVTGYQTSPTNANKEISIENLNKIGYNKLNEDGYRVDSLGNVIEISLLVNKENSQRLAAADMIVSQLKDVGLKVKVVSLPYNEYLEALESGTFELYLGEIKLDNNFDITELVIEGGRCAFGKVNNPDDTVSIENVINEYKSGSASITNVITALQAQMPFIPICYRSGIVFYNENIQDGLDFSEDDLFLSIERLTIN